MSRLNLSVNAHLRNPFSAVTMGAASTRPSLRPRSFRGQLLAKLGRKAPREREPVIARSESDVAIQTASAEKVWIASLTLAMTRLENWRSLNHLVGSIIWYDVYHDKTR